MKINRIAVVAGLLMGLALSFALAPQPAQARDGSELVLFQKLNGERTRTLQSDGGGLMLWTTDAGIASATVSGGGTILIECPTVACHICGPLKDDTWDGGCSNTVSDPNYGSPIAIGGQRWISLRDTTSTLKGVPASGSASCSCPVFYMR